MYSFAPGQDRGRAYDGIVSQRWDGIPGNMMAGLACRCDNCIIQTMVALQFLSCICNIVACLTQNELIDQAADLTDLIADIVWCADCGCMQTQVRLTLQLTCEQ